MGSKADKAADKFAEDADAKKAAGKLPGGPVDKSAGPSDLSSGATKVPERERNDEPGEAPYTPDGVPID